MNFKWKHGDDFILSISDKTGKIRNDKTIDKMVEEIKPILGNYILDTPPV